MSRKKYRITNADYPLAQKYLIRKFHEGHIWFMGSPMEEVGNYITAEKEFSKVSGSEALDAWCKKYLSSQHWENLKIAIRAGRKRGRDSRRGVQPKHIALSHRAWSVLSDLAKRDGVTYSEFILIRLEKEWLKMD